KDFTAFFQGGKLNFGGDFGNYNLVRVYNNVPEIRRLGDPISMDSLPWETYKDVLDYGSTAIEGIYKFKVDKRTTLYNGGYWIDNLGNRRSIRYAGRSVNSRIGLRSDYVRTTAKYAKYADRAGMVGNVISAGEIGYGVYEDNWRFGKNAQVATAGVVGGIVGASEGALLGAYIGSFIPVPGVGTVIGVVLGATFGYIYGEIASQSVEKMYE
ncbi:glycine zipper domain-containing protein, partial [Chryseobacterium indologenes]